MRKISNSILIPIILACILFLGVYTIMYFKRNRDIINDTKRTVIENQKIIQKEDSIKNFKVKADSIVQVKTNDSIIVNQKKIIELLEKNKPVKATPKKKNIFSKIKNIF